MWAHSVMHVMSEPQRLSGCGWTPDSVVPEVESVRNPVAQVLGTQPTQPLALVNPLQNYRCHSTDDRERPRDWL